MVAEIIVVAWNLIKSSLIIPLRSMVTTPLENVSSTETDFQLTPSTLTALVIVPVPLRRSLAFSASARNSILLPPMTSILMTLLVLISFLILSFFLLLFFLLIILRALLTI